VAGQAAVSQPSAPEPPAARQVSAAPDPTTQVALASVLAAARSGFVAPADFVTSIDDLAVDSNRSEHDKGHDTGHDTRHDTDRSADDSTPTTPQLSVPAVPPSALPTLRAYDEIVRRRAADRTADQQVSGGPRPSNTRGAIVESADRQELLERLDSFHADGTPHGAAVVFLDITDTSAATVMTSTGMTSEADTALIALLEQRLRATVRSHEYAAPLTGQGFVVAARGTFTAQQLSTLVDRLVTRLSLPLRSADAMPTFAVSAAAVRSFPGESDVELILRAELARVRALSAGAGSVYFG
jgi:GGDEF domain-containing protein